jgi:RNA polymerase sigma factor (sigma-70 family)
MEWSDLVQGVCDADPSAVERLYAALQSSRYYLVARLGREGHDVYHDLIMDVVRQLQAGLLRDPAKVPNYASVIAHRKVIAFLRSRVKTTELPVTLRAKTLDPEAVAIREEQVRIATHILQVLPARDREILTRFYVEGQTPEAIQATMGISATQFRLLKSRTKARFSALCAARFARKQPSAQGPCVQATQEAS